MKHWVVRCAIPFVAFGLPLLAIAAEAIDKGKNRYDCQVTTVSNLQGWVGVRSDTLEGAIARAGRSKDAATRLETHEPVKEVVQCVLWPDGKFTDVGFQVWFDEVLPK